MNVSFEAQPARAGHCHVAVRCTDGVCAGLCGGVFRSCLLWQRSDLVAYAKCLEAVVTAALQQHADMRNDVSTVQRRYVLKEHLWKEEHRENMCAFGLFYRAGPSLTSVNTLTDVIADARQYLVAHVQQAGTELCAPVTRAVRLDDSTSSRTTFSYFS